MPDRDARAARAVRPLAFLALSIGIGLAWIALESLLTLASGRVLDPAQHFERMVRLLPFQLGLFAGLGVGVALLSRLRGLGFAQAGWWLIGAGSFVFLGEALLGGLLRKHGPGPAALGLALLAAGLALLAALSLALARRLPERAGRAFTLAAWSGWSVFFVLWLQHSIAVIRIWEPGIEALSDYLRVEHLLAPVATGIGVGLLALLGPRRRAAALAGLLLLSPLSLPARTGAPSSRRPDVFVILIDTLRFDHIGADVGVQGLTPELDALARESILFTRTYSPGNYTKLALPGIHTSLPFRVTSHPLPEETTTLAEHLKAAGYATYGISTNPHITKQSGYGQGFDLFLDPTTVNQFLVEGLLGAAGLVVPGLLYRLGLVTSALYYEPAAVVRRRAIELFRSSPSPKLVYLQTMDPHGPYLPPQRYLPEDFDYRSFESYFAFNKLQGRGVVGQPAYRPRLDNLRQRYRGEVRFTDDEIGELVRELKESGRWDEMLVFVLSDHGEAFGEKDWAGHSGHNVSGTLVHVPFLVKLPRSMGVPGRVETSLVSTYDLLPTTLALLGLPPAEPAFGCDLSPLIRTGAAEPGRTVVSYALGPKSDLYTVVRWPFKLDIDYDQTSGETLAHALYDLELDPVESRDIAAERPAVVAELVEAARTWREREEHAARHGDGGEIDPLVREQLRKLGYAE